MSSGVEVAARCLLVTSHIFFFVWSTPHHRFDPSLHPLHLRCASVNPKSVDIQLLFFLSLLLCRIRPPPPPPPPPPPGCRSRFVSSGRARFALASSLLADGAEPKVHALILPKRAARASISSWFGSVRKQVAPDLTGCISLCRAPRSCHCLHRAGHRLLLIINAAFRYRTVLTVI
jgi:hypothetical protein